MRPFPFTAVVGMDDLRLALILNALSPAVGGVLVRGEKGTAKSTMVRALTTLLPDTAVIDGCRFSCEPGAADPACPDGPHPADAATRTRAARLIELPVGATEDRVLGSLHLERALAEGRAEYEPGLLAAAHRGLLYVDEVNLLHDHLVDVLLDAAAMGRSSVERDGVSVSHAARFVLVGTMNPEEGELRPQLLDRFGLTVEVAASRDPGTRADVVRRRLAYEADPDGFSRRHEVASASSRAGSLPPGNCCHASSLETTRCCGSPGCAPRSRWTGLRADLVTARAAIAHAAWSGRTSVTPDDVRAAARLALPHRRRRNPFDAPGLDQEQLDQALDDPPAPGAAEEPGEHPPEQPGEQPEDDPDGGPGGGGGAPGRDAASRAGTVGAADPYAARLLAVPGSGAGEPGRRSKARSDSGRTVGARAYRRGGAVHLVATIRAAAPHQLARGRSGNRVVLRPEDLQRAVREGRESNLVLFCVDASGSMAARSRMAEVKAAVLSLLLDAYQRRDRVGLVTFSGSAAEVTLPPTSSVRAAACRLESMPSGGRTPLAEGLLQAGRVLDVERLRDRDRRPLLVVLTDGRANAGAEAVRRSRAAAGMLAGRGVAAVVVDCETGPTRLGLAPALAAAMAAEHLPLHEVAAATLTQAVRRRTLPRHGKVA